MSATLPGPSVAVREFLAASPHKLLIGGALVDAAEGRTFETVDPSTGERLAVCAAAGSEDVDRAVRAATDALAGPWGSMTGSERTRLIWRLADLIERDAEPLAQLETLDNGKPIALAANDDLPQAIEMFRYFAGWATKIEGETIPVSTGTHYFNYTLREPVGVVGQIIPWNYPLLMAAWKLAPALASGNAIVLKPAEQTPLSAVWLAGLIAEAGFPDGVVNVLTGDGPGAGAPLAAHAGVAHVAFTGSSEVGREIVRASAGNLKSVSLELGGKSPNVIFADADIEGAIEGARDAIFYNMGQDCAAGSRLFIESSVYDDVVTGLAQQAKRLKIGAGFDEGVDQGPLVSAEQRDKVLGFLEGNAEDGVRVVAGGGAPFDAGSPLANGYFVQPTVLVAAGNDHRVAREEIFGPVVAAIPFHDTDDAILQGNDTRYGLGAGVWTGDVGKAHRVARALQAGSVWINCYNVYDPASPFGGYKESGFGRDMGRHVLESYTRVKSVWLDTSR